MAKKGGTWQGILYLYDQDTGTYFSKDDDSFEETIINTVMAMKRKLYEWQITMLILNHQFIVLETNGWWWSIEKDSEGILIQRSKTYEGVVEKFKGESRIKPIVELKRCNGKSRKMKEVVDYIYDEELSKKYDGGSENCQHFAYRIFYEFAD
jgi:hypothetical protein